MSLNDTIFILPNSQWLALFGLLLISFITAWLATLIIDRIGKSFLNNFWKTLSPKQVRLLHRGAELIGFSLLWVSGIPLIKIEDPTIISILKLTNIIFTIGITLVCYYLVDFLSLFLREQAERTKNKIDDIVLALLGKTLKVFIIVIAVVVIGEQLNVNMKSLLAGLGIGGLALAFAAKDTLSNLFGSITVVLDHPFQIGDLIQINEVEGTVEEVGLRSTRIRTFEDSLVSVPNSQLANTHVNNYGRRRYRRLKQQLGFNTTHPWKGWKHFVTKFVN